MKSFLLALLAGVAAAFISCAILPSGDEASDSRSELKKDGELALALEYRSWHKFVSTVERADKEQIREIYVNGPGMKGTETDGFPNGTTFVMEIFAAKRGSLILMPNESVLSHNTGSWRVEVYMTQSLLLPTDAPEPCRWLSAGCGWSFFVKDGPLDTGIHVPKGASVHVVSTGAIWFSQGSVQRDPDGADDATPATYPAPGLRKYSLICKVGDSAWVQCGSSATITPEGSKTLLRTTTGRLVKGKLESLYLMQKGPNWGRESGYETGDWVFDHYSPLTGQLCAGVSSNGALPCGTGFDIGRQHEKVVHMNWSKDCRRCHLPVMQETGSHDRDFVYAYKQHFKMLSNSEKMQFYSTFTKKAIDVWPKHLPPGVPPEMPTYYDRPIEQHY